MRSSADRRAVLAAVVLAAAMLAPARAGSAQPTAAELYNRALALERSLTAPAGGRAPAPTAAHARRVITAYELIVRRFPRSGYADNALWQAGQLALDTARRHGELRERAKGVALLGWLVREYPASRLVGGARDAIARAASPPPPPSGRLGALTPIPRSQSERPGEPPPAVSAPPPLQPLWALALRLPAPTPAAPALAGTWLDAAPPSRAAVPPARSPAPGTGAAGVPPPAAAGPPVAQTGTPAPAPIAAPATAEPSAPAPPPAAAPDGAKSNSSGGFSLARQLGLGVSRIVVDPGHGGQDPGAIGNGTTEAQVVLDVALRLESLLKKDPALDVVLTRRADVFVPLEERTAIANRAQADLFISIHANASRNPDARGVETYFLNFASNLDAEAVAARENATSAKTMASLSQIVRAITLNTKLDESRDLAGQVHRAMVRQLKGSQRGLRDLGVRQAPFVVLIGATMPSVLAEISFISNRTEGKLLRTPAYRQRIAESILEGIRRYQASLKAVRTVPSQ